MKQKICTMAVILALMLCGCAAEEKTAVSSAVSVQEASRILQADNSEGSAGDETETESLASALDVEPEYFFRDSSGFGGTDITICYAEEPWDASRNFGGQLDRLLAQKVVPEVKGYDAFDLNVYYDVRGDFYVISILWQCYSEDGYKQLSLGILPEEPQDLSAYDGYNIPDYDKMTATQVGDVTVYGAKGEGMGLGGYMLVFTLPDGSYCQMDGVAYTTAEEMVQVLDFFLKNGVNYDALTKEKGDEFTPFDIAEHPDAFIGCIPDPSDLPLYSIYTGGTLKNGEPYYDSMQFSYEEAQYCTIHWDVYTEPPYYAEAAYLGNLPDLREEEILNALEEDGGISFMIGDFLVYVVCYSEEVPTAVMLELIKTLPDYPAEETAGNYMELFRDNTGQSGGMMIGCGTDDKNYVNLDFSEKIEFLLREKAITTTGCGVPEITVRYLEQEVNRIHVRWSNVMELLVYPEGEGAYVYHIDEENCTQTEIQGVTVYADGAIATPAAPDGNTCKALSFTLTEGSLCQIIADETVEVFAMEKLAEFLIQHGVNLDAFEMENGDEYDYIGLEELPAYFRSAVPEDTDTIYLDSIRLRRQDGNGVFARLTYSNDAGAALYWDMVFTDLYMKESYWHDGVIDLQFHKLEDFEQMFMDSGLISGAHLDSGIYVRITTLQDNLGSELYQMFAFLRE